MTRRKDDTIRYMKEYQDRVNAELAKQSYARKAGGWISNLIVYGTMALIVGGALYQQWNEQNNPELELAKVQTKIEKAKSKVTPTGEELARMAAEKEAREAQKRSKFEQEISNTYDKVQDNQEDEDILDRLTQTDEL